METFSNVMYHTGLITVVGVAGNFVIFAKNFTQIFEAISLQRKLKLMSG